MMNILSNFFFNWKHHCENKTEVSKTNLIIMLRWEINVEQWNVIENAGKIYMIIK